MVARALRRHGFGGLPRGPRAATRSNPAELTDRECEILGLVCEGLSNSAISARLVVSTKTVDHHVSAVLRKLGVQNRRDAARRAQELAIVPQDR